MPKIPQNTSYEAIYKKEHNPKQLVVMSNKLARATWYSLSLMQEKVLYALISNVKPKQHILKVRFNTKQFRDMIALSPSGTNFKNIMDAVKKLADRSFYLRDKDGKYHLLRWINGATADPHGKGKGDFVVKFNPYMKGLIFLLNKGYTTIAPVSDIALMQSTYSMRLYFFFKSFASLQPAKRKGMDYSLNEIKKCLHLVKYRPNGSILKDKNHHVVYKYPRYSDFKKRVLHPAVVEINRNTECNIKMRKLKHGRVIVGVNVVLTRKNSRQKHIRDDRYYRITHGISKKDWPAYKRRIITGTTKTKRQQQDEEIYKIKHYGEHKTVEGQYEPIPHPFQIKHYNYSTHMITFYSPFNHKFVTRSLTEMKDQKHSYNHIEALKKESEEIAKKFKK